MRLFAPLLALLGALAGLSPAAASAQRQHRVRAGQSLFQIAHRYHITPQDLAAANRMRIGGHLRPGRSLTIPAPHTTYVQRGQTLAQIARQQEVEIDELRRLNRLARGARLRIGQRLILPGYQRPSRRRGRGDEEEEDYGAAEDPGLVHLDNRHHERRDLRLRDAEGRVLAAGLEGLGALMRRDADDAPRRPHPRLAAVIAAISDHFGGRAVHLVSGYRRAGGYTADSSRHLVGRATDIRVEGVENHTLWRYCLRIPHTGCGYYPRSTFVHVDVRDQETQWVDWSRPGRPHRYGNLRGPYRQRSRGRRGRRGRSARGRRAGGGGHRTSMPMNRHTERGLVPLRVDVIDAEGAVAEVELPEDVEEEEEEASPDEEVEAPPSERDEGEEAAEEGGDEGGDEEGEEDAEARAALSARARPGGA